MSASIPSVANLPATRRKQNARLRRSLDRLARGAFAAAAVFAALLLLFIFLMLIIRAAPILKERSLVQILAGQIWKPGSGLFGLLPFFLGTIWTTGLGMVFAIPLSLLTAVYLSEYAAPLTRSLAKPILDILAGIPSVIYGMWGVLVIVPWVQNSLSPTLKTWFPQIPLFVSKNPTGYSILTAAIVLAVMTAPLMIAIMYEVIHAVPGGIRESSLAVGANRWQTIKYAVLPKASSGILAAVVLGVSRALGETMAVLMVVGNVANIPVSIFDAAYPIPALIANNYGEMMSIPLYDSAMMTAALLLLIMVLIFNISASIVLRRRTTV